MRIELDDATVTKQNRSRLVNIPMSFCIALSLRIIWMAMKLEGIGEDLPRDCFSVHSLFSAFNRLAQLIFFTACTSVVGFWLTVIKDFELRRHNLAGLAEETLLSNAIAQSTTRRGPNDSVLPVPSLFSAPAVSQDQGLCALLCSLLSPDMLQLLLNFWMYVIILGLHIYQFFECDQVISKRVDYAETGVIALFYYVLSVMYLVYGYKLIRLLRQIRHPLAATLIRNTIFITLICVTSFLLNGFLRSLTPIFNARITGTSSKVLYPWFILPVPELLPTLLILHLMTPVARKTTINASSPLLNRHIEDDYAATNNPHGFITDSGTSSSRFWA